MPEGLNTTFALGHTEKDTAMAIVSKTLKQQKTLPEAQRTQAIESSARVNFFDLHFHI